MTNEEERKEALPPPEVREPWSIWWSRVVQVAGLGIMGYETFVEHADRQWLLLCSMGMMIGEIGLKALFRMLIRATGSGT